MIEKLLHQLIKASARGETNKIYSTYKKLINLYNKLTN